MRHASSPTTRRGARGVARRVTSPARTLLDLASVVTERELAVAMNEAQVLGLVRPQELRRLAGRTSRPGVAKLREPLPDPRTQARLLRYTVDFLWPQARVIVEVDGYQAHGTRLRFESDRERDAALVAAGYRVLRFTWRQIVEQPEVVAARLAVVLSRPA